MHALASLIKPRYGKIEFMLGRDTVKFELHMHRDANAFKSGGDAYLVLHRWDEKSYKACIARNLKRSSQFHNALYSGFFLEPVRIWK